VLESRTASTVAAGATGWIRAGGCSGRARGKAIRADPIHTSSQHVEEATKAGSRPTGWQP